MQGELNEIYKNQKRVLITAFLLVFTLLVLSYVSFQQNNISNMRLIMSDHEKISVETQAYIIREELSDIDDNLEFLHKAPTFDKFINGENTKSSVEKEWAVFVNSMKKYDKLRYIDANGNEILRIDYLNNRAKIIDDAFLQNEKDEYYFIEALASGENEIYVSKFDLGMKNNALEVRQKPIVRVALPVFDKENKRQGIVMVDYLVETVLHEIKKANKSNRYMQLVNSEGYWLVGADEYGANGRLMYQEEGSTSFGNQFPAEWARIKKERKGNFLTANGVFTFQAIDLANDILHSRAQLKNTFKENELGRQAGFLISQIPASAEPYANEYSSYLLSLKSLLHTPLLLLSFILSSFTFAVLFTFYKDSVQKTNIALSYDRLTGCLSRVFGIGVIEKEIKRADRYQRPLSLLMMDLDHFKEVNDVYGHPIGDIVLKNVANIAKGVLRKEDSIIRLGGEEFLILLPEASEANAYQTAEKVRIALADYIHPIVGKVTASFGIGERVKSELFQHWYERIDAALYRAKSSGRNKVVIASDQDQLIFVSKQLEWKHEWESGNKIIDVQHFNMLKMAKKLIKSILSGVKDEEIMHNLDILLEDIKKHFEYEELVLNAAGYKQYKQHSDIHKELILKATELKKTYLAGEIKPSTWMSFIISDLALGHMIEEDRKIFPFLNKANK